MSILLAKFRFFLFARWLQIHKYISSLIVLVTRYTETLIRILYVVKECVWTWVISFGILSHWLPKWLLSPHGLCCKIMSWEWKGSQVNTQGEAKVESEFRNHWTKHLHLMGVEDFCVYMWHHVFETNGGVITWLDWQADGAVYVTSCVDSCSPLEADNKNNTHLSNVSHPAWNAWHFGDEKAREAAVLGPITPHFTWGERRQDRQGGQTHTERVTWRTLLRIGSQGGAGSQLTAIKQINTIFEML